MTEQEEVVVLNLGTLIDDHFILHTPEEPEKVEFLADSGVLFF